MPSTLTEKFSEITSGSPERVCMLVKEDDAVREYTYDHIYQSSLQVAHWLCREGIQKGDRVAIALENRPEWCICYFGLLFSGAIAVPVDIEAGAEKLHYFLAETQTKILFASDKVSFKGLQDLKCLQKIVIIGKNDAAREQTIPFSDILHSPTRDGRLPSIEPEDMASILYTSGTTGSPKGVMLTHHNFYANFTSISKLQAVRSTDNFLSMLPLHHSFPFMGTLILPLFSRAKITYVQTLKAEVILKSIREQEVTILAVTPQVLQYFYKRIEKRIESIPLGLGSVVRSLLDLSWKVSRFIGINLARPVLSTFRSALGPQFRYFISGGAKLDAKVPENFFQLGFEVLEGYGLTETAPVVSLNPPEDPKIGSVGKALPDVEIKILDPDEQGLGQILIKGANVMKGYYKNEEATQAVIKNGWFYSGDLGYIDNEGYLFVKGRVKDIIVLSSGKNIFAEDVEKHYLQAPSIKEMCVLAGPGEEKLVAVIVADTSYLRAKGMTDIRSTVQWDVEQLSESLAPYERIRDFMVIETELPKTRLGEVKRHEVKQIYEERAVKGTEEEQPPIPEDVSETGERVMTILMQETGKKGIALDDHLELDLGIDSLGRVELMTSLEEEFGIDLPEEQFLQFSTVAELIQYMEEIVAGGKRLSREKERSWEAILQAEPPDTIRAKIDIKGRKITYFFTISASLIFDVLFKLYFRLTVYGTEHLGQEAFLICPNHASYLDGFVIFSALPWSLRHRLFFLGYSEYFEIPIIRNLVKPLKVIPVKSSRHLVESMQASAFVLKNGKMLCIFPEGARSISGEIKDFKKGVGILAKELGVKVMPAYISGTHHAWKTGKWFPKPYPITVVFGQQYLPEELEEKGLSITSNVEEYKAVSIGLREEVLRLKKEFDGHQLP